MNFTLEKNRFGVLARAVLIGPLLSLCLSAAPAHRPKLNPVQWNLSNAREPVAPGSTIVLRLHAEIAPGYHLYSLTTPDGGPIRTTLSLQDTSQVETVSVFQPKPDRHNDPNLNVPVETFTGSMDFPIQVKIRKDAAPGAVSLIIRSRYQACSDVICLPPVERTVSAAVIFQKGAPLMNASVPAVYHLVGGPPPAAKAGVVMPLNLRFFLLAFGFGLAALFTPCVFPTVPLTISYFLNNQQNSRYAVLRQALLFSAGIVALFSAIGAVVTLIAGPFGVVQLSGLPLILQSISKQRQCRYDPD